MFAMFADIPRRTLANVVGAEIGHSGISQWIFDHSLKWEIHQHLTQSGQLTGQLQAIVR